MTTHAQERLLAKLRARGGSAYVKGPEVRVARALERAGLVALEDNGEMKEPGSGRVDGEQWCATLVPTADRPKLHHACTVVRTCLVTRGTMNLTTGAFAEGEKAWETKPCGVPLFSEDERRAGTCKSCARGWNHPNNYRADGPRPETEIDPEEAP